MAHRLRRINVYPLPVCLGSGTRLGVYHYRLPQNPPHVIREKARYRHNIRMESWLVLITWIRDHEQSKFLFFDFMAFPCRWTFACVLFCIVQEWTSNIRPRIRFQPRCGHFSSIVTPCHYHHEHQLHPLRRTGTNTCTVYNQRAEFLGHSSLAKEQSPFRSWHTEAHNHSSLVLSIS